MFAFYAILTSLAKIGPLIGLVEKIVEDPNAKKFMLDLEARFKDKTAITIPELLKEAMQVYQDVHSTPPPVAPV